MARRLSDEERADRQMSEAKLNSRITYRTKKLGWSVLRIQRSLVGSGQWRTGATKGFPDLLLVGDRILYRELKKELGKLDPEQERWRDLILAAGGDYGVWRPSDLRTGRIMADLTNRPFNG